MSGFVIYSMGDSDFMRLALLGLSHAFEQGAISLAKIGLMLGLLCVFWNGIWNPGRVEFKQFFIGFFLVIILFGKSVPVTLIHSDGLNADQMPDIPIGIALAGTITTKFGYSLASSMRDFYHTAYLPGDVETGSYRAMLGIEETEPGKDAPKPRVAGDGMQPLRELMKLRFTGNKDEFNVNTTSNLAGTTPKTNGASISSSVDNYINDCVLKDQYLSNATKEVDMSAASISDWSWDAMKVTYNGWTTKINIDQGQGWKTVGCGNAYQKLTNAITDVWSDVAKRTKSANGKMAYDENLVKVGQTMLGDANIQAWKIKVNQVLYYHYMKVKSASEWNSPSQLLASQAEFEAIDQRRTASATQYSVWSEMAIPLMTYIEAFVFLIGPLMPFVIAFGEKGMQLVLKYFFLLVWVNTWPILQVGVNMYLQNAINKASFSTAPFAAFSWAGFNSSFTDLESFIAMGSVLQTMVPALSLVLLYGSVQTMVNLTKGGAGGGAGAGSNISPQSVAPAHSGKLQAGNQTSSYDAQAGGFISSYSGGTAAGPGMKQYNSRDSSMGIISNGITAAKSRMHSAGQSQAAAVNDTFNTITQSGSGNTFTTSQSASTNAGAQRAASYANTLMKSYGMESKDAETLGLALSGSMGAKAQLSVAAALGLGEDGSGVSAKFGAAATADAGIRADNKVDTALSHAKTQSENAGHNWSDTTSENASAMLTTAEQFSKTDSFNDSNAFGRTGQKLNQASVAYQQAEQEVKTESLMLSKLSSLDSGIAFSLGALTSDSANNHVDEQLATGELQARNSIDTAKGLMGAKEMAAFTAFKNKGNYGSGLDGEMRALKAFSETDDGANLRTMDGALKTQSQYAEDYSAKMKQYSHGDSSLAARRAAMGRVMDDQFKDILQGYGKGALSGAANYLDQLNAAAGGGIDTLAAAANNIRDAAEVQNTDIKSDVPESHLKNYGERGAEVDKGIKDAEKATAATNVSNTRNGNNLETKHKGDLADLKDKKLNNQGRPESKVESDVKKSTDGIADVVDRYTDGMGVAAVKLADTERGIVESLDGLADSLQGLVNGTALDKANNELMSHGISKDVANIFTGQGDEKKPFATLLGKLTKGLTTDATDGERRDALEVMTAAKLAGDEVQRLRASDDPDNQKIADFMERSMNGVNRVLDQLDGTQKAVLSELSDSRVNGTLGVNESVAAMSMLFNNDYTGIDKVDLHGYGSSYGDGTEISSAEYNRMQENLAGGHAALKIMENHGLQNSAMYTKLQDKLNNTEQYLADNREKFAWAIGSSGYKRELGPHEARLNGLGGKIIQAAVNGGDFSGLDKADLQKAISSHSYHFFTGKSEEVQQIGDFETMRNSLQVASNDLRSSGFTQEADRLDAQIQKYTVNSGLSSTDLPQVMGIRENIDGGSTMEITQNGFDTLSSLSDNSKVNIGGVEFTKTASTENGTIKGVNLTSENGNSYYLSTNSNGANNLTMESGGKKF